MKILIVGAGVGGLALAAYLKQKGIDPLVIEKAPEWKTIGYVLGLFPNGVKVLSDIGADKEVIQGASILPGFMIRDERGRKLWLIRFSRFRRKYGPVIEVERDKLHQALRNVNQDTEIRMNTTIKELTHEKRKVHVVFSDGQSDTYDLVVGADGINSQIRQRIIPSESTDYTGTSFSLFWVPPGVLKFPKYIHYYVGRGRAFALFPSNRGKKLAAAYVAPARPDFKKDIQNIHDYLQSKFVGMGGAAQKVLDNLPERAEKIFFNRDDEMHVDRWYRKRVVLLGDAAHALSPILGMGASMALEDAFVLAEEVARAEKMKWALERYQQRRQPRVDELATWSRVIHRIVRVGFPAYWLKRLFMKYAFGPVYFWYLERFLARQP